MPTGVQGYQTRRLPIHAMHFFRKEVVFGEAGAGEIVINEIRVPKDGLLIFPASGVHVVEAFNAATTNTLDIGFEGSPTALASALDVSNVGWKAADENTAAWYVTSETNRLVYRLATTGAAATAGRGIIVLGMVPNNDR